MIVLVQVFVLGSILNINLQHQSSWGSDFKFGCHFKFGCQVRIQIFEKSGSLDIVVSSQTKLDCTTELIIIIKPKNIT